MGPQQTKKDHVEVWIVSMDCIALNGIISQFWCIDINFWSDSARPTLLHQRLAATRAAKSQKASSS